MDEKAFEWYLLGLKNNVNITSLYEYFLYSIPKNYYQKLPLEISIF